MNVPLERRVDGRILQVGGLMPSVTQQLQSDYEALVLPRDGERAGFLAEHGPDVVLAATSGGVGVSRELMDALPNLEAIVNFGVGYDTTDMTTARSRGIAVSNTPDVLTDCVADLALALLIDVFRQVSASDRFVREGRWLTGGYPLMRDFSGSKVGIVGLGRIGKAIAHRLRAFNVTVSYHNRKPADGVDYQYFESPVELAANVDALVVAAAGGTQSQGLVSRAVLEALGSGYLVNIARGAVVDQDAMVELLTTGQLGGVGLDVYVGEPNVPPELFALDNVVLVPHIGSATVQTRQAMADLFLENLQQFLHDRTLRTPV